MLIVRTCHTDWETDIPSGRVVIEESKPAGRFAAGHPVIRRLPVPAIPCNGSREAVYSPRKETEMTEALIVIDVQNDFCPGGALAVPGGDEIVAGINERMAAFETVILTQDWHPADHSSFASRHSGREPIETVEMSYGPQVLWPDHCVQGTDGAGLHPALDTTRAGLILRKGFRPAIDSYSAFFENDRETPTGLDGYLRTCGIRRLTMVGLATDFCVSFSALDAARLGFAVTVELSLCRAIDLNGSLRVAMEAMREAGVDER